MVSLLMTKPPVAPSEMSTTPFTLQGGDRRVLFGRSHRPWPCYVASASASRGPAPASSPQFGNHHVPVVPRHEFAYTQGEVCALLPRVELSSSRSIRSARQPIVSSGNEIPQVSWKANLIRSLILLVKAARPAVARGLTLKPMRRLPRNLKCATLVPTTCERGKTARWECAVVWSRAAARCARRRRVVTHLRYQPFLIGTKLEGCGVTLKLSRKPGAAHCRRRKHQSNEFSMCVSADRSGIANTASLRAAPTCAPPTFPCWRSKRKVRRPAARSRPRFFARSPKTARRRSCSVAPHNQPRARPREKGRRPGARRRRLRRRPRRDARPPRAQNLEAQHLRLPAHEGLCRGVLQVLARQIVLRRDSAAGTTCWSKNERLTPKGTARKAAARDRRGPGSPSFGSRRFIPVYQRCRQFGREWARFRRNSRLRRSGDSRRPRPGEGRSRYRRE